MSEIKQLSIDDFKGGRTNFFDQVIIPENMCTSGSQNVWAPEGGLTKVPGMVLQASFTASGTTSMPWFGSDDTVSTANKLFYRITVTSTGGSAGISFPYASGLTFTDSLTPLGYTTGTVSISGASLISATGSGTSWLTNVSFGDRFQVTSTSLGWYQVASVEDNTHLTLSSAVPQAITTGSTYTIQPHLSYLEIAAASLNGSLVWTTTGDIMQRYDGTGMLRVSTAPQAAFITVFKNYLFAARSASFLSRVFWSTLKDPTSWPSTNFIDVDVLGGQLTGLFAFGTELIVFKTRGMYKIIGDVFDPANPTFYVIKITTPPDFTFNSNYSAAIHTVNPATSYGSSGVSVTNGVMVFYGGGRIYKYSQGASFITDISPSIIRDLPNTFSLLTDVNPSTDQRINAISYNGYYVIKGLIDPTPRATSAYMSLILDRNMSWWYLSNTNCSTQNDPLDYGRMTVVPSTTSRPVLAVSNLNGFGKIYSWDFIGPTYGTNFYDMTAGGASSTAAINSIWVSKEFNIEYGVFKWLILYLQKQSAGNLTVQWSIDQAANVSYTQDMTKGRGNIIRAVIPIGQKGSTIQLTLSNSSAAQTFKVYAIKVAYEPSPMERLL